MAASRPEFKTRPPADENEGDAPGTAPLEAKLRTTPKGPVVTQRKKRHRRLLLAGRLLDVLLQELVHAATRPR